MVALVSNLMAQETNAAEKTVKAYQQMIWEKIILNLAVTLYGFIEGPNGEIDWCIMEDESGIESHFDQFNPNQ